MLGVPVDFYFTKALTLSAPELWLNIQRQIYFNNYIFVASTDGIPNFEGTNPDTLYDDTTVNECGLTNVHSFPIIDVVPLYSEDKKIVLHELYMLRDPKTSESII